MIETDRLILRRWKPSDRPLFAKMNADPRVMEFFPAVLTPEESDLMADRIEAAFRKNGFSLFAAELRNRGEFIGFVGLSIPSFHASFTPCVEIGWRIASDHWGLGLATEGALAVAQYAFNTLLIPELVAFTSVGNVRSTRVMEKLGMQRDPAEDFDHPGIPEGHPLRRHVLYRLKRPFLDRKAAS